MTPENRNLIMAVALSMIVLLGWQMLVIQPEMEREAAEQAAGCPPAAGFGGLGALQACVG